MGTVQASEIGHNELVLMLVLMCVCFSPGGGGSIPGGGCIIRIPGGNEGGGGTLYGGRCPSLVGGGGGGGGGPFGAMVDSVSFVSTFV